MYLTGFGCQSIFKLYLPTSARSRNSPGAAVTRIATPKKSIERHGNGSDSDGK